MQKQHRESIERKRVVKETVAQGVSHERGRPPLPKEVARSERVVTFVTQKEKTALSRLAAANSLSVSAICHQLIAQGLRQGGHTKIQENNEGDCT